MAFLDPVKLTDKLYLPSRAERPEEEKIWVVLKDQFLGGDLDRVLTAINPDIEPTEATIALAGMIEDWNLYDVNEPDKKLPINIETVNFLQAQDKIFLKDKLQEVLGITADVELDTEQKKTSGATLTPPTIQPTSPTQTSESPEQKMLESSPVT